MDEDEIELIEKVWRGEAATDEEIEKNVDNLFEMVIDETEGPEMMNKFCITEGDISAEMRRIETNLAVHNFIGNGEEVGGELVFRRDLKP
jgi:hypothetical protein